MPTPRSLSLSSQDFWQFSLSHYARAGVKTASLTLQNEYQGNVNLALLLHWLDTQRIGLTDLEINALITVLTLSDTRLEQYRAMRQQLKPQLDQAGYQQLLAFELELEKSKQHELLGQINQFACVGSNPTAEVVKEAVTGATSENNLARYCQLLGASTLLLRLQAHQ
ncbi:TIGR02444 family protein [Photobacterium chitinilyticum]|uniref:TIGR02444 family protein n=1 Tax=Photobacterium chitinilyticum TaxID=2485123 RepID=UPI003D0F0A2B